MFRPTSTDIGILFLIRGVLMIPVNRIRRDAVQSLICRAFINLDFSLTRRGWAASVSQWASQLHLAYPSKGVNPWVLLHSTS